MKCLFIKYLITLFRASSILIHRVVLLALNLIHPMDKTVCHSEMQTGQQSRVQTYSTSEPPTPHLISVQL